MPAAVLTPPRLRDGFMMRQGRLARAMKFPKRNSGRTKFGDGEYLRPTNASGWTRTRWRL